MIEYRSFRNADPPQILRLWHGCELGRAAAVGFTCDALDHLVFSKLHFDPRGLIVALDGPDVIGFVHAGFAGGFDTTQGVICAVMVRPDHRRRGIGRQLVRQAESYLQSRGAAEIFAGESGRRSPFYLGLYGASDAVGFLESDPLAKPFLTALGYAPIERHLVFRRDISQKGDPFDPRVVPLRRKMQLGLIDHPPNADAGWMSGLGRLDTVTFALIPNGTTDIVAGVTVWGMDFQSVGWRRRTVGLSDLFVPESCRRKAYAKTLLIEVFKKMRDELVNQIDLCAPEGNVACVAMCQKLGFDQIDAGVVYRKNVVGPRPPAEPGGEQVESHATTVEWVTKSV